MLLLHLVQNSILITLFARPDLIWWTGSSYVIGKPWVQGCGVWLGGKGLFPLYEHFHQSMFNFTTGKIKSDFMIQKKFNLICLSDIDWNWFYWEFYLEVRICIFLLHTWFLLLIFLFENFFSSITKINYIKSLHLTHF